MCLECPEQMPAFTEDLQKSRSILQFLAAGLFILSLFALLCGQFMFIFFLGLLAYILYLSWAEFNYSMTLNYFLLCIFQCVFVYVQFIGLIQYYSYIEGKDATKILFIVAKVAYFPNAVFFSHIAYRHFKQYCFSYSNDPSQSNNYQMIPMSPINSSMNTFQNNQNQNDQNRNNNQASSNRNFRPFQGQPIVIG